MRLPALSAAGAPAASGVPVTEAGGNVASSTAAIGTSTSTRADTVDTRCHTPGAGRTTSSSGTVHTAGNRDPAKIVSDKVDDHDVLCDVLDRCPQGRRIRVPRQRALDRTRRHRVAAPPQKQLRRQRCDRTPIAGQVCGPARGRCAPPRRRRSRLRAPSIRPDELRAHTRLVDLARRDRVEAGQHTSAVRFTIGLAPGNRARRGAPQVRRALRRPIREAVAPERLSYHQWPSRSWRSTQSDQPPAASGMRGPRPSAPASGYDR